MSGRKRSLRKWKTWSGRSKFMENAANFTVENGVLTKYTGSGGNVVIPDGVRSIGDGAFDCCKELTGITIPDSVKAIGEAAFNGCSSLTAIIIPKGVRKIKRATFSGCSNLADISIPDSVKTIGDYAFNECSRLANINLPSSITAIGEYAFFGCESLTSIVIPDHVTTLGKHVFDGYSILSEITLPSALASRLGDILSKMVMPVIHVVDILCVSTKYRPYAAVGFAEDERDCTDENGRQYIAYIKSNAVKLAQAACEHPALLHLMIRENLIAAKDLKRVMAAVEASCKAELVTAMLEYSSNISKNDDTKANVRKDRSHGKSGVQL